MSQDVFHRPKVAEAIAKMVLEATSTSGYASGLFLAAPRRTGKSTFLREDLRPQLEAQGALVLYADLWEDRQSDPGEVIVKTVRAELAKHAGVVAKLARSVGLEKVSVAGALTMTLHRVGLGADVSLAAALAELSDATRQPIVLIIDEAQHAITTQAGSNALFALKAARDELNSSRHHGLRVIATGSSRDKLAMLRNSRDQAFYQAPLQNFPPLGREYIEWLLKRVKLPIELDVEFVHEQFAVAAHRPEILTTALDALHFEPDLDAKKAPGRLRELVNEQVAEFNKETLRVVHSLTPLQAAVLRVLAARGERFAPFESATLAAYEAVLKKASGRPGTVSESSVQQALVALQERSLVWRATRGVYALEELSLADLMRAERMLDDVPNSDAAPAAPKQKDSGHAKATGKSKR